MIRLLEVAPEVNWTFYARILRVIDGDTFHALVDRGFHDFQEMELRLRDVDAPEVKLYAGVTEAEKSRGMFIRADLISRFAPDPNVIVVSEKYGREKYGRYLSHVWHQGLWINDYVVELDTRLKAEHYGEYP
jgi:micrococcal nuclease